VLSGPQQSCSDNGLTPPVGEREQDKSSAKVDEAISATVLSRDYCKREKEAKVLIILRV
jgi:hypothetical protein